MTIATDMSRSPYAIGVGLGLLNVFAFATAGRGLGITTKDAGARQVCDIATDGVTR